MWLRTRHVRNYADVAARAVTAAHAQHVVLPGEDVAATIVTELAASILALDGRLKDLDTQIAATFAHHEQAATITSMSGFGPILGATLVVTAGDLGAFPAAGHLAAAAGLVPVRNDSGRRSGTCTSPTAIAGRCGRCSTCPRKPR